MLFTVFILEWESSYVQMGEEGDVNNGYKVIVTMREKW